MKSRRHTLAVTLSFDKPCTAAFARREAANCIPGEFYTDSFERGEPETMKVRSFHPLPAHKHAISELELALIYLEDGARVTARMKIKEALRALAPDNKILADADKFDKQLERGAN